MLRALCLAMTILVLPSRYASADAAPDPCENAALKYWQAFATLPNFTGPDGQKLNAECLTMPLDAHAREMVTKAEHALQMLHRGARLPRCDWGIGYEEGYFTPLPHGPAARVLCSLACLRARMRFEAGQSAEAIDDIVAAMTLGRQVSQDSTLFMVLVGYGVEPCICETLALYLPRLNASVIKDLQTRLDALPPGGRPAKAMKSEARDMEWFVRKIKEAKDEESLLALVSLVAAPEGTGRDRQEQGRAFLKECGGTADGVVKFHEELRPCFELLAKMMDLPLDQFEKEWEREEIKRTGNPVFKRLFPPMPKIRRAQARTEVRRALLSAAFAVQLNGPDALKNHPDPVVGGPFGYVAFDGGFELRSKLKQTDDKPVALTVGLRVK